MCIQRTVLTTKGEVIYFASEEGPFVISYRIIHNYSFKKKKKNKTFLSYHYTLM